MVFDIRLLDNLSYDEAELLLEGYIVDAIDEFVKSETGQAYVQTCEEGGAWISNFIELAYLYGEFTLSKMTKANVQEVMEYILPRKLTVLDPSSTDDAIPELVAFWTFLREDYKLRSAGAIVKYLQSIQDKFRHWMFDPARGGMAKSFLMEGTNAGYDMTSPEGIEAFKNIHNQQLQANLPATNTGPMTTPPKEVQQMLDLLGVQLPKTGQPVNPASLLMQIMTKMEQIDELLGEDDEDEDDDDDDELDTQVEGFLQAIQAQMIKEMVGGQESLSEEAIALLKTQTITDTEPGTLLRDFQTVLDSIGSEGIPVSGKRHQLSMNLLPELNQRLSHPIETALKRPQQQSYPPIHGLYLLLRATGIAQVVAKGKQYRLMLNPSIYDSWQQLNPTERYCTLLEAWLVRSRSDMLGEERSNDEGLKCLQMWPTIAAHKKQSYAKYSDQETLSHWPGLHNVALMQLFGMLSITSSKPEAGKGWRIKNIEALPWGKVLMSLTREAFIAADCHWPSAADPTLPVNELQPALQPYFPQWQKSLALPKRLFRPGRHIFKVSLGKVWRRIAMSGEATLADFSDIILASVDFDSDHLDLFAYTNELGCRVEALHPDADGELRTDRVKIGDLPIAEGSVMLYLFDFGDEWEFEVLLEAIEEPKPETESGKGFQKTKKSKRSQTRSRQPLGEILEVRGKAPPQYPDYDDEDEDEDD